MLQDEKHMKRQTFFGGGRGVKRREEKLLTLNLFVEKDVKSTFGSLNLRNISETYEYLT
jgi:hypothetical protein